MKSNRYVFAVSMSAAVAASACSAGFNLGGKGSDSQPESSPSEASGSASEPASAAQPEAGGSGAKSGPSDRVKEMCTHKADVSALCIERLSAGYSPDEPDHYGYVRGCFEDTWAYEKNAAAGFPDEHPRISAAEELAMRPELADDKYVKECLRVTTLVYGKGWSKHADEVNARFEFVAQVGQEVETNFKKKCGVHARIGGGGGGVQLVLEKPNKKKAVFYKGTSPDGNKITVRCDGSVTSQFPSGGSSVSEAQTEDGLAKDADEAACIEKCAKTNQTCIANNGNVTVSACRDACLPQCSK